MSNENLRARIEFCIVGAGREAAKQRGVCFGRPRKLYRDQVQVASQLLAEGKAVRDIARTFNVRESTINRLAAARCEFQEKSGVALCS